MIVSMKDGARLFGISIMTCCAADTAFSGLFSETGFEQVKNGNWVRLTAKISVKRCVVYGRKGPVLRAVDIKPAEAPADPVATFY